MMKNLIILLILLFSINLFSQENSEISILEEYDLKIQNKVITPTPLFILDGKEISYETFIILNSIKRKEILKLEFLTYSEAKLEFNDKAINGVVRITPYKDDLLNFSYYKDMNNDLITERINSLIEEGKINYYPILVFNGIPLRGDEIKTKINQTSIDSIVSINLLKQDVAYKIYGIRAINGVLIVTTKQ